MSFKILFAQFIDIVCKLSIFLFFLPLCAFSQPIITPTSPLIERWPPVQIIEVEHKGKPTGKRGLVFFRLNQRNLCAFDANTGEEKFREDIGLDKYTIAVNDKVYIGKYKEGLFVYDLNSGISRKMNSEPLSGYIDTAPIYDDDLVYVLTSDELIYAFDADSQNSEPLWRFPTNEYSEARRSIKGRMIISLVSRHEILIGTSRGQLFHIRTTRKGAEIISQSDVQSGVRFKPVRNPNNRKRIYLIIQGGTLMAVDLLTNGDIKGPIWKVSLKARANENILVTSDDLLCVPIGKEVVAYRDEGRRCSQVWTSRHPFKSVIKNPLVEYGDEILVVTDDVIALSKRDGTKVWSYNEKARDLLKKSIAIAAGADRSLSRFEESKHREKYFPPIVENISSSPEVRGDFIYCAMKDKVYAFSPRQLHSVNESPSANTLFYWKYEPTAGIKASPALYDNFLYVGTTTGTIYTVDINTGMPIGEPVNIGENDAFVGLVADRNSKTLYAVTSNGSLYFYDLSSNIPKQKGGRPMRLNSKVFSAPTLLNKRIYIGSERGLYVVDIQTRTREKFDCKGIRASPWILQSFKTVCFGTQDNKIYGVSADYIDQEKWRIPVEGEIVASASELSYSTFYVGDNRGNLYAIGINGQEKWSSDLGSPIYTTPDLYRNAVYVTTQSGDIYKLDQQDGKKRRIRNIGTAVLCSFVVGKYLIVMAEDGNVHAFDEEKPRWVYREINSKVSAVPTVGNNVIYIISENGKLFALDIGLLD